MGEPWDYDRVDYDLIEQHEQDRADHHIAIMEEIAWRESVGFDLDFEVWFNEVLNDEHFESMQ